MVEWQHGMAARADHGGSHGEVPAHRLGVAARQYQGCALALLRTDGTEDVGGGIALVLRRRRPGAAPGPAACDLVLLAYPGLIGEPNLESLGPDPLVPRDTCQRGGEVLLNAAMAPSAWAWCFGRAENLRRPISRRTWLSLCGETEIWNSSHNHWPRSVIRQRTTPWIDGVGPRSMISSRALDALRSGAVWGQAPCGRAAHPPPRRRTEPPSPARSAVSRCRAARLPCGCRHHRSLPAKARDALAPHPCCAARGRAKRVHRSQDEERWRSTWRASGARHGESYQPHDGESPRESGTTRIGIMTWKGLPHQTSYGIVRRSSNNNPTIT